MLPVATLAVTVPFPVPEAGLSDNQVALSLALQLKVPPPVLLMVKVLGAGLAPAWAVKDRLVGLIPKAGGTGAAVMVKVTGIVIDAVPVALRVMVPL